MLAHGLSKPKILIIEDNCLVADAICDLVRDCGYDVAAAVGRVEHGVRFLADRTVDGAVVDISLHGSLSFSICNELQRRNVPFFFLTGHVGRTTIPAEFREARLLTKPLDVHQFKSALADFGADGLAEKPRRQWGNLLLDTLPDPELRVLAPKLEGVALREGQYLEASRQAASHIYFPIQGLVSIVARCPQGKRIEIGLAGPEGVTGVAALLEAKAQSAVDAIVQLPGAAWRISAEELAPLLQGHRGLHAHLLRYVLGLMAQIAETTLATGVAKIEQRLARWLLMAADRCGTTRLAVTHEDLSRALAVRRSGITMALHMLESRHLIRSQRKSVEILDRAGIMKEVDGLQGCEVGDGSGPGAPVSLRGQDNQAAG